MPRLALVFLPLILALASSPQTHAAEGLILINQHKVNESGGFPYSITRAGSYRLTGNLEVPAGVAYWRHFQSDRQQPRQLHHSQLPLPRHSRRLERPR